MIYIYKYKIDQIPQSLLNIYIYLCYDRGNEDKCCVYVYVFCAVLCLCFVLSSVYVFCAVLCLCVLCCPLSMCFYLFVYCPFEANATLVF